MRRSFIYSLPGLLLVAALATGKISTEKQKPARPNIVLIMADDLGYGDLGCYGQQRIRTPNIDALAKSGMRFTRCYAGSTVCAPSREALLTGMHTGHTAIRGNFLTDQQEDPPMPDEKLTIAEMLKKAGYHTGLIGKWGLGGEQHGPEKQGFDYCYGYLDQIQAHNYYPPFLHENGRRVMLPENEGEKQGAYSHHLFVEKTMRFLNDRPEDQPFFLYLPYTIPHGKHVIPDASEYAQEDWPEQFRNYAAMITQLDKDIGRIVSKLKESGLDKNTLILFTSDNGANPGFARFFKSNGPFRGSKTNLYEGGIREPLIACWPGVIKAAQVSDHVTAGWDLLPTICEAAAVKPPSGIDGISFLPTLTGRRKQLEHSYLYWEYYTYNYNWNKPDNKLPRNWLDSRALRFGNWKVIVKSSPAGETSAAELYDLQADPSETSNIAAKHPDVVRQANAILLSASRPDASYFPYKTN